MHNFRPLASYRYDTALVGPEKLTTPPASPKIGDLIRDEQLGYYLYQMAFVDLKGRSRLLEGIFGVLEISNQIPDAKPDHADGHEAYIPDHILVHEQTLSSVTALSQESSDVIIARPGAGPIWAISAQSTLRANEITRGPTLASASDHSGVVHTVWHITDTAEQERIELAVRNSQLIIADGHHRIARAMKLLSVSPPQSTVRLLCFVTDLDPLQAEIRPIHRCFKTSLTRSEIMLRLERQFEIEPFPDDDMASHLESDALLLLVGEATFKVRPFHSDPKQNDAITSQIIAKVLEARSTQYITDARRLRERVLSDPTKVALLTRPVTIKQIRMAAFGKNPLPPKSTMFYPKPLPGLIFGEKLNL